MKIIEGPNTGIGCYVEGWWGQYAMRHLVDQFANFDTFNAEELAVLDRTQMNSDDGPEEYDHETLADIADAIETQLSAALPTNRIATWKDGEFFILPFCGGSEDCADDECGCQDW